MYKSAYGHHLNLTTSAITVQIQLYCTVPHYFQSLEQFFQINFQRMSTIYECLLTIDRIFSIIKKH